MATIWEVTLDHREDRRRASLLEGRASRGGDGAAPGEELEFSLTLYRDQVSLNLPASPLGREFIGRLIEILGTPKLEPTIKCSCSWGDGVMGAMLAVLWDLPSEAGSPTVQELYAFLGISPL